MEATEQPTTETVIEQSVFFRAFDNVEFREKEENVPIYQFGISEYIHEDPDWVNELVNAVHRTVGNSPSIDGWVRDCVRRARKGERTFFEQYVTEGERCYVQLKFFRFEE